MGTLGRGGDEPPPPPGGPVEPDWSRLLAGVLGDPARLRLVFQPIVSLAEGVVVGYEALSRFDGPPGLTPDRWFAAADRAGLGARLEALVVRRCLRLRTSLPPNCFLTVNVSPHLLVDSELSECLLQAGDLRPLILELTEHQQVSDMAPLLALRHDLTARGALLALDDAGSGYSGLQQMTQFRPHLIKLDRALVGAADQDEAKLALAELLGQFGSRIDAWLLAEGLETWGECEAFLRLRVPLGQGYLLGRPGPPWTQLEPHTAERLRRTFAKVELHEHVASLVDTVPLGQAPTPRRGQVAVRTDGRLRPMGLILPLPEDGSRGGHREVAISLRVALSESVSDLAARMVGRPEDCRFDPAVCVDRVGRALGVVRVERVVLRLAELKSPGPATDTLGGVLVNRSEMA